MNKKLWTSILGGLVLYFLSTGVSYAAFHFLGAGGGIVSPLPAEEARQQIDLSAPKTETCPINGGMFTKVERQIWEGRRPIAVMIENHEESRPQSGLSKADVVYEAVAEGGITRFMGIFYCGASAEDVRLAPVRSARIYFVNLASEYGLQPIFAHVGGANDFSGSGDTAKKVQALETLVDIGWRYAGGNDLDTTFDGNYPEFYRDESRLDHPVAVEHTMVSSTDRLWAEAESRDLVAEDGDGVRWDKTFESWLFKDDASSKGDVSQISFDFWDYEDYSVEWRYDAEQNAYLRFNGGQSHIDLDNDQQLTAKTVVVQFAKEEGPLDRNKHLFYQVIGKGTALVFQDGEVIKGSWVKSEREERTRFLDSAGKQIKFNRGPVWIEVLPQGNEVSY